LREWPSDELILRRRHERSLYAKDEWLNDNPPRRTTIVVRIRHGRRQTPGKPIYSMAPKNSKPLPNDVNESYSNFVPALSVEEARDYHNLMLHIFWVPQLATSPITVF